MWVQASRIHRNSYFNSEDKESLGLIVGAARHPDQDKTFEYLKGLAEKVDSQQFMVESCLDV